VDEDVRKNLITYEIVFVGARPTRPFLSRVTTPTAWP
jgi:hypothetical protein